MTPKRKHKPARKKESAPADASGLESIHSFISEIVPVGLALFDEDLTVIYANPQLAAMLGTTPAELVGSRAGSLPCSHEISQDHLRDMLAAVLKAKSPSRPEDLVCRTVDGQIVKVSCSIYPAGLDGGAPGLLAIFDDVTARRKGEEQRLEKMRVQSQLKVLSSLSGAISSLGSFRQIVNKFASAAEPVISFTACATLNLDTKPLILEVYLTSDVGRAFIERLQERMLQSAAELVPEWPKGQTFGLHLDKGKVVEGVDAKMQSFMAVPIVVDNTTTALLGFASSEGDSFRPQDISFAYTLADYYSLILSRARIEEEMMRREMEDQLHRERLELEAARREAEIEATRNKLEAERKAVRELKRVDELKDEFISTVSHEMRTPMTSIKSSMDLLLSGRLGEIQQEHKPFLEIAVRNLDRLSQLLNDVLNVSRIESGRLKMTPGVYEVRPLVEGVIQTLKTKLLEKEDTASDEVPEKLTAYFDRNSLIQILTNLVANAINHNEPGISVAVRVVSESDGFVTISVTDTGAGIAEKDREKIFERFHQAGRTYGEGSKGTGLGLTISRGLTEAMGGRIWVEGKEGEGADFRFTLPLTRDSVRSAEASPAAGPDLETEVLFGKIAVLMGLVTNDQINECAREQAGRKKPPRLGEMLVEKGFLTSEQRDAVLKVQERNLSRFSARDSNKALADNLVGDLAVGRGLVTREQLNECLREQALEESEGRPARLGELMVRKGLLSVSQILSLLSQQKSALVPARPGGGADAAPEKGS